MDDFNLLPAGIISDILSFLPAESVLECKLVSKTWRNLIRHPSFSKMHTNRLIAHSAAACTTDSRKLGFLALGMNKKLYYFEYIENHETSITDRVRRVDLTPPFRCYAIAGSINGLVCLRGSKESICICNPMTREYVILPEPKRNLGRNRWMGFGYLASTNEYKVVLVCKLPNFVEVMVYTLGSGNGWRNIGKFKLKNNYVFQGISQGIGIFVNGALHWIHKGRRVILVFDLADEKFRDLSPPPFRKGICSSDLGVLGGFFFCKHTYLRENRDRYSSDIWLYNKNNGDDMKEQDEHRPLGWSKGYFYAKGYSTPLAFTKSGGVLTYTFYYLSIYDDLNTSTPGRQMPLKEQVDQVVPHKNSFVSLKELGEEGTKLMDRSVQPGKRKRRD